MNEKNEPLGTGIPHGSTENEQSSANNPSTAECLLQLLITNVYKCNNLGADLMLTMSSLSIHLQQWNDYTASYDDIISHLMMDGSPEATLRYAVGFCLGWMEAHNARVHS